MNDIERASQQLRKAIEDASDGLVDRRRLIELVVLAAVASEHVLVVGPPGTAKSAAVQRIAQRLGGTYFEYLLGRFTEPSELFGPVDIAKLQAGRVEFQTQGMLPEAQFAFLDEVFHGSTAILNTLLTLLNERVFRRGHTRTDSPLRVCVGATNQLPQDESLAAFADRFLVHVFVTPVADETLEDLLDSGWRLSNGSPPAGNEMDALDTLQRAVARADLSQVRPHLAEATRLLRKADIILSDRRIVKTQRLVAAAALLDGREHPTHADLWPLIYAIPSASDQQRATNLLRALLDQAASASLAHAAEDATAGIAARAQRIAAKAKELLDAPAPDQERWRLELEALAREIDSSFASNDIPETLLEVRNQLKVYLED